MKKKLFIISVFLMLLLFSATAASNTEDQSLKKTSIDIDFFIMGGAGIHFFAKNNMDVITSDAGYFVECRVIYEHYRFSDLDNWYSSGNARWDMHTIPAKAIRHDSYYILFAPFSKITAEISIQPGNINKVTKAGYSIMGIVSFMGS
ncbi:MAG: hypothetical protein JSW62_03040 [Thermoplasmatales archaeon]|nr:MAG: hypothetical protein JSW62_03040 [Thermoplasmatales archaeon]